MQDTRKIRQTFQTILALAMIVAPVALAQPFDWRALVVATLGGIMAVLTNPRLVVGLSSAMPLAGSAILPPSDDKPAGLKTSGGPGAAAIVLLLGGLLLSGPARAQAPAPQFGGCFSGGAVCLGPSVTISVAQLNLSTSKFTGGVMPGVGYGATFMADSWHTVGLDLYVSAAFSQSAPNNVTPALMLSFANYVRAGIGYALTETSGPLAKDPILLFGIGSNFGGSPSYVKAAMRASQ